MEDRAPVVSPTEQSSTTTSAIKHEGREAARGDLRQWIVIGVQSPRARYHALFAQKLLPLLPDLVPRFAASASFAQ